MENDPLMVLYPSDTLREMARLAFAVVAKYDIPLAPGQNAVIEALEYFADSGNEGEKERR